MRTLRRATFLWLILTAGLPGLALAHAMLLSSTPDVDSTLTSLPPTIVLTFDEDLTADSSFKVLDAAGSTVATGGLDAADPKSMTGPMPALANGVYEIKWTAISSDDLFVEHGSYNFTVALATEPPATPTPAPNATAASPEAPASTAPSTPAASATPAPSASGGTGSGSGTDVLVPIAAMVLVIGIGLAWFLRRRGAV